MNLCLLSPKVLLADLILNINRTPNYICESINPDKIIAAIAEFHHDIKGIGEYYWVEALKAPIEARIRLPKTCQRSFVSVCDKIRRKKYT